MIKPEEPVFLMKVLRFILGWNEYHNLRTNTYTTGS